MNEGVAVPSNATLITIYGWRCPTCGAESAEKFDPEVVKEWRRRGHGRWLDGRNGWPLQIPAWMAKAGFRCRCCGAATLMALTPAAKR